MVLNGLKRQLPKICQHLQKWRTARTMIVYTTRKGPYREIITNEEGGNGLTGAAILDAQQLLGDAKDVSLLSLCTH
ncbi:hypothetical protein PO124_31540 [Bacillus licheniformis]|nr:hypothetical protein [Bacillus licheniformis]